jgi:hypothetical protein
VAEADHRWIKSRRSIDNGACVELAVENDSILVRHSQHPDVYIRYTRAEIAAFFEGVRNHEFDDLIDQE